MPFAGVALASTEIPDRWLRRAMLVGVLALPLLPVVLPTDDAQHYETGFSVAAVAYVFLEPFVALGAIASLLVWSRRGGARYARCLRASRGKRRNDGDRLRRDRCAAAACRGAPDDLKPRARLYRHGRPDRIGHHAGPGAARLT